MQETAEPEPIPVHKAEPALSELDEDEIVRYPRSKFLEASTLGLGAVIGGVITLPILGFTVAAAVYRAGPS